MAQEATECSVAKKNFWRVDGGELEVSWRERAQPIIAKVLREMSGKPEAEIRKVLYDVYPFGVRQYHPYKIWLDEIKRQRGTKGRMPRKADVQKLEEWEALYGRRQG